MDMYSRSMVSRLMEWLDHIFQRRWKVDAALPILARISTSTSDSVETIEIPCDHKKSEPPHNILE